MYTKLIQKNREAQFLVPAKYCNKKVIYDKKGAVTAKNKREKDGGMELRIYPCKFCNGWHLTSQVQY